MTRGQEPFFWLVTIANSGHFYSIIFSFWTTTLDLVGKALKDIQTAYVRVDGTVPRLERQLALRRFKGDPSISVILISLRCGANGLNLTAANHVFLMEPQWNPALEDQALDRVHRMGQTKAVTTVRYITKNSIEEVYLQSLFASG